MTLVYVGCFFHYIDCTKLRTWQPAKLKRKNATTDVHTIVDNLEMLHLTHIVKCFTFKLFFWCDLNQDFIDLIVNMHQNTTMNSLNEWVPIWGNAGDQLSILYINMSYLDAEEPQRPKEVGVVVLRK